MKMTVMKLILLISLVRDKVAVSISLHIHRLIQKKLKIARSFPTVFSRHLLRMKVCAFQIIGLAAWRNTKVGANIIIKLNVPKQWKAVKNYVTKKHGICLHF